VRIREYTIASWTGKDSLPGVALLTQVHGVGPLIALTAILTLEDLHFAKSRDVGCYVGLQPARRNSGSSQPQLRSFLSPGVNRRPGVILESVHNPHDFSLVGKLSDARVPQTKEAIS
jgi:Transposase IS116/IS110/IS902 family